MIRRNLHLQALLLYLFGLILRLQRLLPWYDKDRFHLNGFGLLSQWLGTYLFHPNNHYMVPIGHNGKACFNFKLNDIYWSTLVLPWVQYESEIAIILNRILTPGTIFIDCGANIGYWSVFASTYLAPNDIIAVEPYSKNFNLLSTNASNNGSFICVHAAITDRENNQVSLSGSMHASMKINRIDDHDYQFHENCNTITLDKILRDYVRDGATQIVLKLDIEGAEKKALMGAGELLNYHPFIIYEDHGKDHNSTLSKQFEQLGYHIYFCDQEEQIQQVSSDQLSLLKRSSYVGYNFFAISPTASYWTNLLLN